MCPIPARRCTGVGWSCGAGSGTSRRSRGWATPAGSVAGNARREQETAVVTASDDIPDLVEPVGEPSPDEIAEVAATGYPPVDAAIQRLHALPGRPTAAHP